MSGSASGYFLLGIWTSLVAGVVVLASVLIRRPVTGCCGTRCTQPICMATELLGARAHDVATLTFAVLFGARYLVQDRLYDTDATGWLAVRENRDGCAVVRGRRGGHRLGVPAFDHALRR